MKIKRNQIKKAKKKQRNKKIDGEILDKHIKKNRDIRYGRNLKKKKEQSIFEF